LSGKRTNEVGAGAPGQGALRLFDHLVDGCAALAAILLLAVMLATTTKVVFRYGFGEGLLGIDQISGTMLLYIAFLGAAWVLRREEHVTIDLLSGALSPSSRRWLRLLGSLLGAAVCFCIALFGTLEVVTSLQKGIRIAAEIEYPRALNLVVIPFGCLLLGLQFLRRAWLSLAPAGDGPAPTRRD
jgi:TRAP-type C4-dicarboxylate transport system permease small subunit